MDNSRVYEDFVPTFKVVHEEHMDTLHLNLPDYKKEQLRVQLTITGILKISGQREIVPNKWQKFQEEFPIAKNCDKSKISAKFENGILYVLQPKITTSAVKKDRELPATEAESNPPKRQKTTLRDELKKKDDLEKTPANNISSKTSEQTENTSAKEPAKEEANNISTKTSEQTEAKGIAENSPVEKSSKSSSSGESANESTDGTTHDEKIGNAFRLDTKRNMPWKVIKMTLAALLVLGIGLYVADVLKSTNEAE